MAVSNLECVCVCACVCVRERERERVCVLFLASCLTSILCTLSFPLQHETDAHWIAKSSQGAHGFALSTGATAESSEQSSGAAKEDKHGAYALSEVSTPGFGYFTLGPKNCSFSEDGGADSAGSQRSTEGTVVEYKVLQGTIDQASLGHGGEVAAVYARLPYHTSSAAKEEEEEEERGQGAAVMEAGYVATLQTHLDLFHQQIHSIHTGSLKSQPTVLIIDFTPLHQSEVMPAMKGRRPDTDVFQMDTLDVLGTLLSLLEGGDEGGGGCQGIFFLSVPKNSANDSPLDHMNSMATAQLGIPCSCCSYYSCIPSILIVLLLLLLLLPMLLFVSLLVN